MWTPLAVELTDRALRDVADLDAVARGRVLRTLQRYAATGAGDVVQLRGEVPPAFRLRVGDWRVVFSVDEAAGLLLVERVGHRREVYR